VPSYSLRAIVLRKTKLGETDSILTLLASDGRQVRAVAKGLRRPGSKFGARLEPYTVVDLLLHTGKSLEVIQEAQTVATHAALREELERGSAAAVVADVLDKISLEGQPEERLFGLAEKTLEQLTVAEDAVQPVLVTAFLVKAMAMHGYRPELEGCAACGADPGESESFSISGGGVLCPLCAPGDPSSLRFSAAGRAWLATMLNSTMAQLAEFDIPRQAVRDCFELMRAFVAYHVATRLRALDFYAGLISE
jgi:DNA repair protein RecO (recombination protein O)